MYRMRYWEMPMEVDMLPVESLVWSGFSGFMLLTSCSTGSAVVSGCADTGAVGLDMGMWEFLGRNLTG